MINNCPCDRNCPQRSIAFCPICEKGRAYKKGKLQEYEENLKRSTFKSYESDVATKKIRKRKNCINGKLK